MQSSASQGAGVMYFLTWYDSGQQAFKAFLMAVTSTKCVATVQDSISHNLQPVHAKRSVEHQIS